MAGPKPTDEEQEARSQLILENLSKVRWIAGRIHAALPNEVCLEDLVSTGIVGLIVAIDNYDSAHNAKFQTYAAHRIRGAILDSIRKLDGVPPHHRPKAKKIQRAAALLAARNRQTPASDEIAEELGISVVEYFRWIMDTHPASVSSLDALCAGTQNSRIDLADQEARQPDRLFEEAETDRLIAEGLESLPPVERAILQLYYMEGVRLAEIAERVHLHVSRISQLKLKATARLRAYIVERWTTPSSQIPRKRDTEANTYAAVAD